MKYIKVALLVTLCLQSLPSVSMSDQEKKDLFILAASTPLLGITYLIGKYVNDHRVVHRFASYQQTAVEQSIECRYQQQLTQLKDSKGEQSQDYKDLLQQKESEKRKQGDAAYNRAGVFISGCIGGIASFPAIVPLAVYKAYCSWYQ